ncbi:MAG: hypothetical protein WAM69_16495 [Candidatus Sulfotelmatobacter sp.]
MFSATAKPAGSTSMEEENTPIYLCRGVTFNIQTIWPHSHHRN